MFATAGTRRFHWWFDDCHPGCYPMSVSESKSELASSESLQKLDQRHEELLVKLDALCHELETALRHLQPKQEAASLKGA